MLPFAGATTSSSRTGAAKRGENPRPGRALPVNSGPGTTEALSRGADDATTEPTQRAICGTDIPTQPGLRRPMFGAYLLAVGTVIVDGNLLADEPLWHEGRLGHVTLLAMAIRARISDDRKAHHVIALISMIAFALIVGTRFWLPR